MRLQIFVGLALAAAPVFAHHSMAAYFDEKKPVTLKGTVSRFDWSNPHVFLYVDVDDPRGRPVNWTAEFDSIVEMKRAGWSRESFQPGDAVTLEGYSARDGSKQVQGKSVAMAGGKKLAGMPPASTPAPASSKPAPKWPDGHVRLGPIPSDKGYWANPSASSLVENTAGNIRINANGLLANIGDAGKVAPLQPWAKGLYEYRQKNLLKDDPMSSCLPPGGPRQFQVANGVQLLEEPGRKRLFILSGGGNRNWRLIPMDGRDLPDLDSETPTYFGFSKGRWDKDTVVIESAGFNERFWFSNGGLPHTENLRTTEKLSRPDYDTLHYEVTINDTGAYTRPWTAAFNLRWVPNADIQEYFCDDFNRDPAQHQGN